MAGETIWHQPEELPKAPDPTEQLHVWPYSEAGRNLQHGGNQLHSAASQGLPQMGDEEGYGIRCHLRR